MHDYQNYQHIASFASYIEEYVMTTFYILQEDGTNILCENLDKLILE